MEDIIIKRPEPVNQLREASAIPPAGGSDSSIPTAAESSISQVWDRVIRGIIYALTFALPLLFTPWTYEPLEFSKQMLLFILTTAALIAWLLKLIVVRSWKLVKTPLDLPILVFVGLYFLASLFSVDRVASFLGYYGSFSGNFFQILFLVLFFYLVVNNFQTLEQARTLTRVFFGSVFVVLAFTVLQFFGTFLVRIPIAKTTSFNTVGGLLLISLVAALAVVLSLAFRDKANYQFPQGRLWRVLTIVASFVVLLTVNFIYAWIAVLVGLLLYMVFQVAFSRAFSVKNLLTPLVLVVLSVSFLVIQLVFPFVSLRSILNFKLPVEVRLDYTTAMPVLKGVVTERPILGTGPGTFLYAFSKHREQNFNLSPFWNLRFDKAPSEAAEYLVATGILGLLAFEILSGIFILYGLFFLLRKRDDNSWNLALALFASFAVLWVAHWFFFFTTVIAFSYWFILAAFMSMTRIVGGERVKSYSFSLTSSPRRTVGIVSSVSLGLVLVIVFLFFTFSVYASDIFYHNAVRESGTPDKYDQAQADFERAVRLNRFRPDYLLTYGEFLFLRINQELTKDPKTRNLGQVQSWLATSINTSKAAVDLSPANWTAWERLANLYTIARPLVAGVDQFIVDSLNRAVENDSKNPILYTELGQVYRLSARSIDPAILGKGVDSDNDGLSDDQERLVGSDPENPDTNGNNISDGSEVLAGLNPAGSGQLGNDILSKYIKINQQNLLKAEEAFRKAIVLKPDYATAYYQLAVTLEQSGQFEKAAIELEKILQRFPGDLNIKFELGVVYYNSSKFDQAARQFQEILRAVPNHANSLFSLALSYERLGRPEKALEEYRKVAELNPDNQSLKDKIKQLEDQLAPKK